MDSQNKKSAVDEVVDMFKAGPPRETCREVVDGQYVHMGQAGRDALGISDLKANEPPADGTLLEFTGIRLSSKVAKRVTVRFRH